MKDMKEEIDKIYNEWGVRFQPDGTLPATYLRDCGLPETMKDHEYLKLGDMITNGCESYRNGKWREISSVEHIFHSDTDVGYFIFRRPKVKPNLLNKIDLVGMRLAEAIETKSVLVAQLSMGRSEIKSYPVNIDTPSKILANNCSLLEVYAQDFGSMDDYRLLEPMEIIHSADEIMFLRGHGFEWHKAGDWLSERYTVAGMAHRNPHGFWARRRTDGPPPELLKLEVLNQSLLGMLERDPKNPVIYAIIRSQYKLAVPPSVVEQGLAAVVEFVNRNAKPGSVSLPGVFIETIPNRCVTLWGGRSVNVEFTMDVTVRTMRTGVDTYSGSVDVPEFEFIEGNVRRYIEDNFDPYGDGELTHEGDEETINQETTDTQIIFDSETCDMINRGSIDPEEDENSSDDDDE